MRLAAARTIARAVLLATSKNMSISAAAVYAARAPSATQPPPQLPSLPQLPQLSPADASTAASNKSESGNSIGGSGNGNRNGSNSLKKGAKSPESFTLTALGRWSLLDRQLPAPDTIRSLHIYDFDNTLFKTPMPNSKLWNSQTMGYLSSQDVFSTGGWWHDVRILAATGDGRDKEEPRAWEGWWNEEVVELARLSEKQPDALCVLLTGRSETGFGDLIKRMVASKGLAFDLVTLKPAVGPNNEKFASTLAFKQVFLETLMETYPAAREIRIYEDRPKHVESFRDFLTEYNLRRQQPSPSPPRPPIAGEVIQVPDMTATLDPVVEVAEVQHMVNVHNAAAAAAAAGDGGGGRAQRRRFSRLVLKTNVLFTGYLIKEADTKRLLSLVNFPQQQHTARRDVRYHGNSIMICTHSCPPGVLDKVGGLGNKVLWEVVATGSIDNSVWAASVRPVPPTTAVHTDGPTPVVVLAVGPNARPYEAKRIRKWHPVPRDKAFVFETTVGEKAVLRVEQDHSGGSSSSAAAATTGNTFSAGQQQQLAFSHNRATKRKHPGSNGGPGSGASQSGDGQRARPPHLAGPSNIPTQPAAFSVPIGSAGGRGGGFHHTPTAPRGGGRGGLGGGGFFRGQGYATGRGGYRGGAALRGRGGGGGNTGAAAAGGAGRGTGRPQHQQHQQHQQQHHFYQSLDTAGTSAATSHIVYDD